MSAAETQPTCALCRAAGPGERLYVGAALGTVHRACFIPWDQRQEAEELAFFPLTFDALEAAGAAEAA